MEKMYVSEEENKISSQVNLSKLGQGRVYHFKLDKEQDWAKELLMELNENANLLPPEMYLRHTSIEIDLTLVKKFNDQVREYLISTGTFKAHYRTRCVRTLKEMNDSLEFDFKAVFLESSFAKLPEYEDQTEAFIDQDMYELYFYDKRVADLKEMLHEYIYLNLNAYPKLEE